METRGAWQHQPMLAFRRRCPLYVARVRQSLRCPFGHQARARLEQFSVFADMHGIDLIGLVTPQLRPREVADLSGIDDAHDVPSLMECKRDAQTVASGCLQT